LLSTMISGSSPLPPAASAIAQRTARRLFHCSALVDVNW
jgi:hypothetical protein